MIDHAICPVSITSYRFFIGSGMLAFFALKNKSFSQVAISPAYFTKVSLIGILNVCVSMLSLQWGVYFSEAGLAAIIMGSNPLFVGVFAVIILREKMHLRTIVCMLFGLVGLSLVIFGKVDISNAKNIYFGVAFSVIASVTFALYTVLSIKQIKKSNSLVFNAISFFAGATVLFIYMLATGKVVLIPIGSPLLGLIYLGIFVTGFAYILYFQGLKKVSAAVGTSFFMLKPVFASMLAYLLLRETLTMIQIVGVCVVIVALSIQSMRRGV
jgi:drug/metabolite transporter (DMT)-like permease